eukprot:s637_g9.t1
MVSDAGKCDEEAARSPSLEELSPSEVDQVMASDTPKCDEEAPLSVSLEVDQELKVAEEAAKQAAVKAVAVWKASGNGSKPMSRPA